MDKVILRRLLSQDRERNYPLFPSFVTWIRERERQLWWTKITDRKGKAVRGNATGVVIKSILSLTRGQERLSYNGQTRSSSLHLSPSFHFEKYLALSKRVEHCASLVGIEHLTKWENSRASLADYCDKLISNYKKTQYRNAKDLKLTQESTDK